MTNPAAGNDSENAPIAAASPAEFTRDRTLSGVQRWMMVCSATLTAPSATPARIMPAIATTNTGAPLTTANPAPISRQPQIIVLLSHLRPVTRPRKEPAIAPPPQQAAIMP